MVGSESELGNWARSESVCGGGACVCVCVCVCARARPCVRQVGLSVAALRPWRPGSSPREGALNRQPLSIGFLERV